MARTAEALVKPELLIWARESASLSVEDAAAKAQVASSRLAEWEAGISRPTIAQLRALGRVYHRPIAIFYLPHPPKIFKAMHDYRRLSGTTLPAPSYELTYEIRRARDRREVALELLQDLNVSAPRFRMRVIQATDPEGAAEQLRGYLGVSREEQLSWKTQYEALDGWRRAIEAAGVLVFQATRVDIDEMRGFSFADGALPVVVVNSADTPLGRVFSMVHEVAHVALRAGGVCDMVDMAPRPPEEQSLEVFCNRVAAAMLLPADWILTDRDVRSHAATSWSDNEIRMLARRYKVSREALLWRLLTLGKTTPDLYREKRAQFIEEYRKHREETKGFAPPDAVAVARAGDFFTRLVLESYHRERITSGSVAEYLDVKLKHLQNIERAAAMGGPAA